MRAEKFPRGVEEQIPPEGVAEPGSRLADLQGLYLRFRYRSPPTPPLTLCWVWEGKPGGREALTLLPSARP